jgi:hypothetical protein
MDYHKKIELRGRECLQKYELDILCSIHGSFVPPLSMIYNGDSQTLIYDCSGLSPLSKAHIRTLAKIFAILRALNAALMQASDSLLLPSGFLYGTENILLDSKQSQVKLIYTGSEGKEPTGIAGYISGIISELPETFPEILCIKDIVRDISERLNKTNSSSRDVMKILGVCERKWGQILP